MSLLPRPLTNYIPIHALILSVGLHDLQGLQICQSAAGQSAADSPAMADLKEGTDAVVGVKAPHEVAWHAMADIGQILKELDTDMERGLTTDEAARRLQM